MANEILADLALRISANTAELKEGLKTASTSVNRFQKKTKDAGSSVRDAFGTMGDALGRMTGGLTDGFADMAGSLGDFAGGITGMTGGIRGATKATKVFKVALASTGIGLLVVALGSLVAYLSQTKGGMEIVSKVMGAVGAVVTTIIQRLGYLGEAIIKLFSGDFQGAANAAKEAVSGIGKEISNNYKTGIKLGEEEIKLERNKIKFLEREAKLRADIEHLKTEFEKEDLYTEEQRLAMVQEAMRLQKTLAKEKTTLAQRELAIQEKKNEMAGGEERIANGELRKTIELRAQVQEIREDEQGKLAEMITMELEMNKALRERAKLLNTTIPDVPDVRGFMTLETDSTNLPSVSIDPVEVPVKVNTNSIPRSIGEMVDIIKDGLSSIQPMFQRIGELFSMNMDNKMAKLDQYYEKERALIEGSRMTEEAKAIALTKLDEKVAKKRKKLARKAAIAEKASAIFSAVINTAMAVSKALAQGGFIAGIPMAAVVGAMGAAQIAMIASQPLPAMANGGFSDNGGLTLVGERGAELVNLPAGSHVTRANKTEQLLGGGSNINVIIESRIRGEDIYQSVREVERKKGNTR